MTRNNRRNSNRKKKQEQQPHSSPEPLHKSDQPNREENCNKVQEQTHDQIPPTPNTPITRREKLLLWTGRWNAVLQLGIPNIFSALVLLVIFWQSFIYERQYTSMQKSLCEARSSRKLENRAYVIVKKTAYGQSADVPDWGQFVLTHFNAGRTPAEGRIRSKLERRTESPPETTEVVLPESTLKSHIVFPPEVDLFTPVATLPSDQWITKSGVTAEDLKSLITIAPDVKAGQPLKIYVYGQIDYTDIFKDSHWTKFCFVNKPGSKDWSYCETYNSTSGYTEEQCPN